jgi:hypothetical protein
MANASQWATRPVDIDFVIDSGLLFEINHTVLHPLGLAMTVKVDEQGNKRWAFKDCRVGPEQLVFDQATMEMGKEKLGRFLTEFGGEQMHKRRKKLGWACQPDPRGGAR